MISLYEQVAEVALNCFSSLPQKCKPRIAADGRQEWTPLAAVVVARGHPDQTLVECVSLATGTKCLPATALPGCAGGVLHDSHAEILALRGFNRWLLQEVQLLLNEPSSGSPYLRRVEAAKSNPVDARPFRLADDVSLHFFSTEAPCGDASMELLMGSKAPEDTVPWSVDAIDASLLGRGHFSRLGVVRRKPARADAQMSLSKSCSDKLALKQVTSVLSFPADIFLEQTPNAFLSSLVVPADQYNEIGFARAFGPTGRMSRVSSDSPYYFNIVRLPENFPRFQFAKSRSSSPSIKASNISALYIRGPSETHTGHLEVLLNGVKQGFKQSHTDPRKESLVCRKQMWLASIQCVDSRNLPALRGSGATYLVAKSCLARSVLILRKNDATAALGGWARNVGDETWTLT